MATWRAPHDASVQVYLVVSPFRDAHFGDDSNLLLGLAATGGAVGGGGAARRLGEGRLEFRPCFGAPRGLAGGRRGRGPRCLLGAGLVSLGQRHVHRRWTGGHSRRERCRRHRVSVTRNI
jgi:hypothetical protein